MVSELPLHCDVMIVKAIFTEKYLWWCPFILELNEKTFQIKIKTRKRYALQQSR